MWRAKELGGPEHLGWSPDTYKQADLLDAINLNTVITQHHGSKKPPKIPDPTYRPKVKQDEEPEVEKVESLADFNIGALMASIGG